MHDFDEQMRALTDLNPGLRMAQSGHWMMPVGSEISYPLSGHEILEGIEDSSYWFKHRNDVIVEAVKRHPPTGVLYDIGGGNGFVSLGLKRAGFGSIVVEPAAHGCAIARARGLPVLNAAFQDLTFHEGAISALGLFDVIEHVDDDRQAFADFFRILSAGGRLYVAAPAHMLLWSAEDCKAGHFRRYSLHGLCKSIKSAGFKIEYQTYFFAGLVAPILLLRSLPSRLGVRAPNDAAGYRKEHSLPDNAIGRMLARSFEWERSLVSAGRSIWLGASCLVIARKGGD